MLRLRFILMVAITSLATAACQYFPESSFELAPSSRLPRWIVLPSGLSRQKTSVTMNYYVWFGGTATFTLYDAQKRALVKVSGTLRGDHPLMLRSPQAGFPPGYPTYEVITVRGLPDIVEHRAMEPVFYMTDDPAVRRELDVPAN
jgi:hypothetical protein